MSMARTMKQNTLPAAVIGAGAWWILHNARHGPDDATPPAEGVDIPVHVVGPSQRVSSRLATRLRTAKPVARAREVVSSRLTQAGAVLGKRASRAGYFLGRFFGSLGSRLGTRLGSGVERVGRRLRRQGRRNVLRVRRYFDQNPLMVGVAGLALGVTVGLLLPETGSENRYLGEQRDSLVDRASERLSQKVKSTAQAVMGTVEESVTAS